MSNLAQFPDLARAREEAAEWVARHDRGLTYEERTAFATWRAQPANARAMAEMSALWKGLDDLQALAEVFPRPTGPVAAPAPAPRRRRWVPALAASLLLALVATGAYLALVSPATDTGTQAVALQQFATAVGEQRSIALDDGSVIALNTGSAVEVSLGPQARELRLLRGEAHFTVAHDAGRPFRVSAAGRVVQAIGTAFDVRVHPDEALEVIVTEGRVKLLQQEQPIIAQLGRGEVAWVGVDNRPLVSRLDGEALNERLAWRNGMLVFDGQTLAAAINEFSRYTADRFVIEDPALGELRIGGYFPAGDTDALAEALRGNFGLDVQREAGGVVRIRGN